jgi:hypothetical protein
MVGTRSLSSGARDPVALPGYDFHISTFSYDAQPLICLSGKSVGALVRRLVEAP